MSDSPGPGPGHYSLLMLSHLHLPQAPGRHPQPGDRSPSRRSPTLHHSRCAPPPHPNSSFACSAPPASHLSALVIALSLSMKLKGSFGTLESQVPQGSIYPTGTRFHIPDFSLISGSPGDKASTRSRGPATRVTCHGNQDSLRLVPAKPQEERVGRKDLGFNTHEELWYN